MKVIPLILDLEDLEILIDAQELYLDALKGIELAKEQKIPLDGEIPTEKEIVYLREKSGILTDTLLALKDIMIKDLEIEIDEST